MISIPGSLSFAKLVMMSPAPAKSAGIPDTRPKIHSCVLSTSNAVRSYLQNLDYSNFKFQVFIYFHILIYNINARNSE